MSDGTITGYVENRLPVTLENAAVYLYGQVLIIGNMEPGQRLEFDREPLKVWPLGMTWMLSDTLTGTPDRQEDSDEEYIKNVQKSNLSGYFTDRYYSSYNGEVRFGAFLPEGYEGNDDLFGKNWDGRTFYTQKIDCAMGTDGEVYRCGQIREPSVTSGIGANYGNSMILYGTDPVVVEYDPGTDIVIEKFSFLPVSDDFFQGNQYSYIRPFSGETSFYNEKTGSYDPVDIRKQDFSREELADYIAADGKITVRLTSGHGVCRFSVEDDGPGVPESALKQIFRPFFRVDASRQRASGGTGMGLSISESAVRAHHGRIWAQNRPGGGLMMVMELPLEQSQDDA